MAVAAYTEGELEAAMAALHPFEARPRLAIGVSGGADSMALCLLADAWARKRGGRITALTVDHRLRAEAAAEAVTIGSWLARRGISHHILVWEGAKPAAGIQAAARSARYALLGHWCRTAKVLHLLVAHHAADQAETVLMRAMRGSGIAGLAGMQPIVEAAHGRILRPLLQARPERLRAFLAAVGQAWIEDPSNRQPAFARVRWRAASPSLAASGIDARDLGELAARAQAAREAEEAASAALLARCVTWHPAGFAVLDLPPFLRAPRFTFAAALARVLACIGGRRWGPGPRSLARLHGRLAAGAGFAGATLAGCRISPADGGASGRVIVVREVRNLPDPLPLTGIRSGHLWDGRFVIGGEVEHPLGEGVMLEALCAGRAGELAAALPAAGVPQLAWPSLPCLADPDGVISVPQLAYLREPGARQRLEALRVEFRPRQPLSGGGYFLA